MKKIISISIMLVYALTFVNCSDEAYNEKYNDPNKITELLMDKLTIGLFVQCNDLCIQGYNRYYSFDNMYLANFTQSIGRPYSTTMYHPGWSDNGESKYSKFFTAAAHFKKLEQMYSELTEAEQKGYEVYVLVGKVHIYHYMLAMLDTYGSIPWTEAGRVVLTGELSASNPHFDKAEDLYKLIIDDMKEVGKRLATATIPRDFTSSQDFINNADLKKWQKYANSLRMRAALRVASNGPITAVGRAALKEMIENPKEYPVVEKNDDNIDIHNLRADPVNASGGGFDGEGGNQASDDLLSRMLSNYDRSTWSGTYQPGIDDPRVPLLYDLAVKEAGRNVGFASAGPAYREATVFRGHSYQMPETVNSDYSSGHGISRIRHNGFFWENRDWDHQIISAAEMWFIRAEAILNGWAAGGENGAKAAFKEGINQSIKFYFKYHKSKSEGDDSKGDNGTNKRGWVINPDEPKDEWISDYAEDRWQSAVNSQHPYENKLDAIITQKYINFNFMYIREAWNDIRRTGYPKIHLPQVTDQTVPNVPVRLRYPAAERDFNKNFPEVKDQDNYTTKMFWAK
ncbi:MAG: SusD/RagB family nutrient-binding outer membrane lipoprotein [Prevotellaceae bacterium]|jgi:hypothetical protein|nr:SusD/RagB family nutrient-binding outer membrane lipoprotein [Prevotellaceae bacterium]